MNRLKIILILILAGLLLAGCVSKQPVEVQPTVAPTVQKAPATVTLNGAGATFPYPLISKWSSEYNKIKPNVQINYQSVGSGAGIKQITERTVDFGASDAPLTEQEFANISGILQIPESIGAVVISYNLPGIKTGVKLSADVVADIFLGKITKWNDPRIVSLNSDTQFPDKDIIVAHRSDGSGTTFVFSDYLSAVSPDWKSKVGKGKSVNWPVGLGGKGNEGVAGLLSQNPYSIGYIELAYAKLQNISYSYIRNKAGKFIEPTLETTANAAAGAALPAGDASWSKVSIVDAAGDNSYPIGSFTYLLVYKDQTDQTKGKLLAEFLWWAVHDGQKYSSDLLYVPLPEDIISLNEKTIRLMNNNGQPLI
ncbi:MAG: phosphate ABC transporter substrate-binding protein PstS [Candidatus Methanoperedens sp.]|nr:phosphate ABC transporter substrate-binding protein PstS [Candidatus Methanoperedens sp.]CAG0980160.1 Phosphate-binding protein PstS [Methanosarcinales archaeon]